MSTNFERCVVDGVRFAAYQNCAINVWNATTSEVRGALEKLDELVGHVSSNHREGVVLMVVITPGNPLPNSAQRKDLEAFFTRWTPSWRAIAYVAEGTDLWSMAARTVMTGMRLVQRRNYPTKVFSEVSEATNWAVEYLVKPPGTSGNEAVRTVQRIVEELRVMVP
jgi:hypothetical protein